jgi:hypothetical protein
MKRSELKNEIESGIRMTCGSWGESYLMIDESAAFDAMTQSFGGSATEYKNQRDEERGDVDISIFKLNEKYYAVNPQYESLSGGRSRELDSVYIECDDPSKCYDGLLSMHGKWESFDDEEDVG